METQTNVSYSQTMKGNVQVSQMVKFDISQVFNNRVLNTSYSSTVEGKTTRESFNKLMKHRDDVYQQIGNSTNGEDWTIKEFSNDKLNKEFKDAYDNHKFDRPLIETVHTSILGPDVKDTKPNNILSRLYSLVRH